MGRREVLLGGLLVFALAATAALAGHRNELPYFGLVGGLVPAVRGRDLADELFDGLLVGGVGATLLMAFLLVSGAVRIGEATGDPLLGVWLATDWSVTMAFMFVPMFAMEAMAVAGVAGALARRIGLKTPV